MASLRIFLTATRVCSPSEKLYKLFLLSSVNGGIDEWYCRHLGTPRFALMIALSIGCSMFFSRVGWSVSGHRWPKHWPFG
jgi:hypothetical protein